MVAIAGCPTACGTIPSQSPDDGGGERGRGGVTSLNEAIAVCSDDMFSQQSCAAIGARLAGSQCPTHPANCHPSAGTGVSMISFSASKEAEQPVPQSIPGGSDRTVPFPWT